MINYKILTGRLVYIRSTWMIDISGVDGYQYRVDDEDVKSLSNDDVFKIVDFVIIGGKAKLNPRELQFQQWWDLVNEYEQFMLNIDDPSLGEFIGYLIHNNIIPHQL